MSTTICFDFGNTRLKAAVFDESHLKEIIILPNDDRSTIEELLQKFQPQYSILSSVINHQETVEHVLAHHSNFHKLSHATKLPFTTPVGKPETIGADRLALCAAAVHLFPNSNNLAIGLGTCITYNFINNQNQFLGGSISPGLEMRFKAMHGLTAKLPLVNMEWNFPLIGYDTKTNLLSGVAWGMAKEIDGIIDAYAEKYGNFNVQLTGGDTLHFAPLLKNQIFADPQLIFKGLYAISEFNR
ncbi:type III pantothenate kinase [Lacibacter luteus]|uniref:Type III pantothenate kinase n=1 Tax=Lacibacter luteus TaxID=2508719 RepID=A0A4Q1CK06_9BACT|nr:type III pantothenate kinase [Lacibacter luteus]RXK60979.1 type III pantothenate kinase [Lacibacter luteus]